MKHGETHKAVKNILHNELGVTNEKIENLISEYIDKKFNKRVDDFLNSRSFEYLVERKVKDAVLPMVQYALKTQLSNLSVVVKVGENKD